MLQNLTEPEALDIERFRLSRISEPIKSVSTALVIDEMIKGMIKLGLRAEKLPNKDEMLMMYNSITEEYQNLKIGELNLAFDLAAKGKLDIEAETYQNFSMLYLHRILRSFARYGLQKLNDLIPKNKELKWQPREVLDDEKVSLALEFYTKYQQWDCILFGIEAFKILNNRGLLKFNSVEILKEVNDRLQIKMMKANEAVRRNIIQDMTNDDYMEHLCYKLVLSKYFDSL